MHRPDDRLARLIALAWMVTCGLAAFAAGSGRFQPGEMLIKLRELPGSAQPASSVLPAGVTLRQKLGDSGWWLVNVPRDEAPLAAASRLRRNSRILAAEPNARYSLFSTVNDPFSEQLYGLKQIQAPAAWDVTSGDPSVVVAVLDTGVDYNHPDLSANMWHNPGEIPGNGLDDDGDGIVDNVFGADFVDNDGDPMDDDGHGTHVAGTIGATANNGRGVEGVAWNTRIMALRILATDKSATTARIVEAFDHVRKLRGRGINVRVINNSWGGDYASAAIREAMATVNEAGVLTVCAAGNDGRDNDSVPSFPCGYDGPGNLSVAASDSCDDAAVFSNWGRQTVHLAAPGHGILSTYRGGEFYASLSGTSMAAPHVSGAAALLLARRPELTVAQIRAALVRSVDVVPAWTNRLRSSGRLNVRRALDLITTPGTVPGDLPTLTGLPTPRITVASRAAGGRLGSDHSFSPSLSADGRYLAFASYATNLVVGKTNDVLDVYFKDLQANTLVRVSQTPAGIGGIGDSFQPAVSADGRFVAFTSEANNLVTTDNSVDADVFVWSRETRALELVSVRPGAQRSGDADNPSISADGRYVAFASDCPGHINGDVNLSRDVFLRDRTAKTTELVSRATGVAGAVGSYDSDWPSLSADGRYVAFHSGAGNLVANDNDSVYDVFVRDRKTAITELVSLSLLNVPADGDSAYPVIGPDGRWVAFSTLANNLGLGGSPDLFRVVAKDRVARQFVDVSVSSTGGLLFTDSYAGAISTDNRYFLFSTDSSLLPPAGTPGLPRTFLFDRSAGFAEALCLSETGQPADGPVAASAMNANARLIALGAQAENLAVGDGNGVMDVLLLDRSAVAADLMIQPQSRPPGWTGAGVIGAPLLQRASGAEQTGQETYRVLVVNSGTNVAKFRLRLQMTPGWEATGVTEFTGGVNISSLINGSGWETPSLAAGTSTKLRLTVSRQSITAERQGVLQLTVWNTANTVQHDSVLAVTTAPFQSPDRLLLSRADDGTPASHDVEPASLSGNGQRAVFASDAPNLGADLSFPDRWDNTNFVSDILLHERTDGTTRIVSRAGGGVGNGPSHSPSISRDGNLVAFESEADNLVTPDDNDVADIFLRNLAGQTTTLVSLSDSGVRANHGCRRARISGAGRWVAFESLADNLVPNDGNRHHDVFLRDVTFGRIERVSLTAGGGEANGDSELVDLTPDGRFVLFDSYASNLAGPDTNQFTDVFLRDRQTGATELISRNPAGQAAAGASYGLSLSDDGRFVLFGSDAGDVAPDDDGFRRHLYLRDRLTGQATVIRSDLPGKPAGLGFTGGVLSPDGKRLALVGVPDCQANVGTNRFTQVFLHDLNRRSVRPISVTRSAGFGDADSFAPAFSADGRYVTFMTRSPLLIGEPISTAFQVVLFDSAAPAVDAWARADSSLPWQGVDLLDDDNPPVSRAVSAGKPARFNVMLKNASVLDDSLTLFGPQGDGLSWKVRYFSQAGVEFIPAPEAGAPFLARGAGAELPITVEVSLLREGEIPPVLLTLKSVTDPTATDSVRLVTQADWDQDGLLDAWERQNLGNLVSAGGDDPDHDGVTNADEYIAGTNPGDDSSRLQLLVLERTQVGILRLGWPSVAGRSYALEYAAALRGAPWLVVTNVPAALPTNVFDLRIPAEAPAGYLRLKVTVP